jgi:hypothetical protein
LARRFDAFYVCAVAQHRAIGVSPEAAIFGFLNLKLHGENIVAAIVELRIDPAKPAQFIRDRIGAQYDYKGIIFSQVPFVALALCFV